MNSVEHGSGSCPGITTWGWNGTTSPIIRVYDSNMPHVASAPSHAIESDWLCPSDSAAIGFESDNQPGAFGTRKSKVGSYYISVAYPGRC